MLNRAFFETELKSLAETFAAESGAKRVYIEVMLRDGGTLRMEGDPVCTDSYIAFDLKQSAKFGRVVIPYDAIVGVGFGGDASGSMGFHR